MTQRRLAVGMGVLFCSFVAILLLILYYPKDAAEEEELFPAGSDVNGLHDDDDRPTKGATVVVVARSLEDFGAAFLALVAVGCIVAGLSCLACACCCVME